MMQHGYDARPDVTFLRSASLRGARRRGVATVMLCVLSLNTACYVSRPMTSAPSVGQRVSLQVTDEGRVALGPQLGTGVSTVDGQLTAIDGDVLLVNVSRVKAIGGASANWSGEQVRIRRADVAAFNERRFSRSRSLLVAGAVVVGVGLFAMTRSLLGFGNDDPITPVPGPDPDS